MEAAIAVPLLIGATGAGAGLSYYQAQQQNRAVSRSMDSANRAAAAESGQVVDRLALERYKNISRARQVQGRIRVASAASGLGMGGSYTDTLRANDYNLALDNRIASTNAAWSVQRINSSLAATQQALEARGVAPGLASIMGAMQGLSTGLSLMSAGQQVGELLKTPAAVKPSADALGYFGAPTSGVIV